MFREVLSASRPESPYRAGRRPWQPQEVPAVMGYASPSATAEANCPTAVVGARPYTPERVRLADVLSGRGLVVEPVTVPVEFARILKENPYRDAQGQFTSAEHAVDSAGNIAIAGHVDGGWVSSDGKGVSPDVAARLKALGVPPAWKNVRLSADPTRALQATGVDSKGRTQYKYSVEHSQAKAAEKFERIKAFTKDLPGIRSKLEQDLKNPESKTRDAAAVLRLIDKTGFRIGSDRDLGTDEKHFGISTLTKDHVQVQGNSISLSFVGKSGKVNEKTVTDPVLAQYLTARLNQIRPQTQVFESNDGAVRSYMQSIAPDYSPKDFRTWHGTTAALSAIKSMPLPKNAKEYNAARNAVGDLVSARLGNTRAVALSSYVDPAVFAPWQAGSLVAQKADDLEDLMQEFLDTRSFDQQVDWRGQDDPDPDE